MKERQISKSSSYQVAFLVDKQIIERIFSLFRENGGRPSVSVACADNSSFIADGIKNILSYPNTSKRRITHISFSADLSIGRKENAFCRISFSTQRYSEAVKIDANGEEKAVLYIFDSLEEIVNSSRQWYSYLARVNFLLTALILVTGLSLFSILLVLYGSMTGQIALNEPIVETNRNTVMQAFFWGAFIVLLMLSSLIDKIKTYLFPMGLFSIGDGIKRNKNLSYIRGTVLGGFALSVISGLILKLF